MELDNKTYNSIADLCDKGDRLVEKGDIDSAITTYKSALDLIPLPKNEWEASTWIYCAIGDAFYLKKDFNNASESFYNALNCPDGIGNPFILMRLGQSLYERNELKKAKEYLLRAYMLEGNKIFNQEDEKYFELIKNEI